MPAPTTHSPALWLGFIALVVAMLAVDLGLSRRRSASGGLREAAVATGIWIALAMLFAVALWVGLGPDAALVFVTGYLIEKNLSLDNIFVFVVVFESLGIPHRHHHRVLYWGVLGAIVLRLGMVLAGTALVSRFHWLIYPLGVFLVASGIHFIQAWRRDAPAEEGRFVRWARRVVPATPELHGERFLVRLEGKWVATPLLLALIVIELSDVLFAIDSIPAIFAITLDPFLVFASNIFAVLGLRSLFFVIRPLLARFRYLKLGLASVLLFVGLKMTAHELVHVPPLISLIVILVLLGASLLPRSPAYPREGDAQPRP